MLAVFVVIGCMNGRCIIISSIIISIGNLLVTVMLMADYANCCTIYKCVLFCEAHHINNILCKSRQCRNL